ncbi:CopG family transcriptional regulator [Clostridium niameyense]|uniref:CopG family transcriptional regulator n=1 Tax=Clostridium niameyense TaxID=1622073 RepID=A0A6M0R8Y1_9CLOT|nr:hypothetical protein [Clostridium niameyense]NEZ46714.1 CopG family transcriptional regulator [Clostridium niameyense]
MAAKKVVINISQTLYNEFDEALKQDSKKSSEFFREAIILYIKERKKLNQLEQMKKGYIDMGEINRSYSEAGFMEDVEDLIEYEQKLSESDFPDDKYSKKRRYILC